MRGDFSRFSHQPHQHYAGVLMQQGRVTLDADWNEQFDIEDHRWRTQTIDTIGRACAPEDHPGFGLTLTPDGTDLVISPGRIYLDGILVELPAGTVVGVETIEGQTVVVRHLEPDGRALAEGQWVEVTSAAAGDHEPVLTRITSVDLPDRTLGVQDDLSAFADDDAAVVRRVTTYLTQPFFPASSPPPFGDGFHPEDWGGATHVVYLDVWRRHVTAIEDPVIREVALGGPDTATRVQTVWAVRILRDVEGEPADAGQIGCADELPAWDDLTAPSAGTLSARAEAAPAEDDPCAIQPEAGYRGLENRLYRVEVHDPGELGTATFKWSRDNGSILSSIGAFPDVDRLDVHSLGRDQVLRFRADDRVEVLSDESELSGRAGTMASIVGAPDEAERRIDLDTDVSVYEDHTRPRVRRWDHGATEITTQPGWVELELGVQVQFGPGPFRTGDYWAIPARVATGDVEGFVDAPPRGIRHHHARLALVTWPEDDEGAILDCRHTFPPLCGRRVGGATCCTVSVGEGGDVASLQEAVDAVAQVPGPVRICVLAGEHRLPQTVMIRRGQLTLAGCGLTSRVVATEGGALRFEGGRVLRVEHLAVTSASVQPTIAADGVTSLEILDCQVVNAGRGFDAPEAIPRPVPPGPIRRRGDLAAAEEAPLRAEMPVAAPEDAGRITTTPIAESLGPAVGTRSSRMVTIRECRLRGSPAVSLQGEQSWVERNLVTGGGVWLREGTEDVEVVGNTITRGHGAGVLLGCLEDGEDPRDDRSGVRAVAVRDNRIEAMTREGVSTAVADADLVGDVEDLTVEDNDILRCGFAPVTDAVALGGGILLRDCSTVRILHNRLEQNGPPDDSNATFALGFGIVVTTCFGLEVHGNTVVDNGRPSELRQEGFTLNVGVAGLGVYGTLGRAAGDASVLDAPAAVVRDNVLVTPEGPSVVVFGVGPVAVADNSVVSRYLGASLLDVGRAILVLNLGAAPDIRVDAQRTLHWPLMHGRVQLHDNQVTVQAAPFGLPPPDPDQQPDEVPVSELMTGSAVAALSFDDVSIQGNQVLNEVVGEEAAIRSSVWVTGATVRSLGNRITELRGSALRSYAGTGLAHNASDNTTTHCMRIDGGSVVDRDNQELFCFRRVRQLLDFVHIVRGGGS
jgi:hypothetical protein